MFRKIGLLFLLALSLLLPGCGSDDEIVNLGNFSQVVQIAFATQPQNINLGSTLSTLRIEGRDQSGNVIDVSQGQVELTLGSNPSGAQLLLNGSPVVSATASVQNGTATFSGISVDRVGTGYTLVATFTAPNTSGSLTTTSLSFNVSNAQLTSVVFLRSTAELWDENGGGQSDVTALNTAFGAGNWTQGNFESADPAEVFQGNRLVFMDGGDEGATAFANFLTVNNTTIHNFVQNGGRVILNSAPNVGGDITTPFGATLRTDQSLENVLVEAAHPIGLACNGNLAFSGDAFAHALVVADDMTPIITAGATLGRALTPTDRVVLAEARVGSGLVLVGGMTTTNFHAPQPQADTLRVNILRYAGGFELITAAPVVPTKAIPRGSSSRP